MAPALHTIQVLTLFDCQIPQLVLRQNLKNVAFIFAKKCNGHTSFWQPAVQFAVYRGSIRGGSEVDRLLSGATARDLRNWREATRGLEEWLRAEENVRRGNCSSSEPRRKCTVISNTFLTRNHSDLKWSVSWVIVSKSRNGAARRLLCWVSCE